MRCSARSDRSSLYRAKEADGRSFRIGKESGSRRKLQRGQEKQTVANYVDIGTSEVSVAVNVQNSFLATAWINLAAGAKADVYVDIVGSGGDAALDPAFGSVVAEFK